MSAERKLARSVEKDSFQNTVGQNRFVAVECAPLAMIPPELFALISIVESNLERITCVTETSMDAPQIGIGVSRSLDAINSLVETAGIRVDAYRPTTSNHIRLTQN